MNRYLAGFLLVMGTACTFPMPSVDAQSPKSSIVIGTEQAYPPYSFRGENGDPVGYNVGLVHAIAKATQLDVEVRIGPWNEIRSALDRGEIDAVVGMFYSEERDKTVDFTAPYTAVHHAIFVRNNDLEIENENDLEDKEIIVMRGDIMHDYVLEEGLNTRPVVVETVSDALHLLSSGSHDCALLAKLPGLYWQKEMGLTDLTIIGPAIRPSNYCLAVTNGNDVLLYRLSEGLALIRETGEHRALYEKWLAPLAPGGSSAYAMLKYAGYVGGPLLILVALLFLWNRSLKRLVGSRTRELVENEQLLDHQNRVLAAIRNVNQLIVREKDPVRLLDGACRLLVESQEIHNVWIVLTRDGRPVEPFFHTDFDGGFSSMTQLLLAGDFPACAQAALLSSDVHIVSDPASQCLGCPLASQYAGRSAMTVRLEHAGHTFGWLGLSCVSEFVASAEEHVLLQELARDIAFGLWSLETATQKDALAQKYATVLATTTDAVMATDLDGRITVFNSGAEKMFGCTATETIGSSIARFCPKDRQEEQAEMMRRVREGRSTHGYETERLTADGRLVPVEITLSITTDDRGRIQGANAILRDISERKQAEERLRANEEKLRLMIEQSPLGVCISDLDGTFISASPAYEKLTGYTEEELQKLTFFDITHPDDRPANRRLFQGMTFEQTTSFRMEKRYIRKDGSEISVIVHAGPICDRSGTPMFGLALVEDITERKQTEKALKESEERFRSYIENAPDGIFIANEKGEYIEVNQAACRMTGYSENELLNLSVSDLTQQAYRGEAKARFLSLIKDGFAQGESGYVTKSGEERFWNIDAVKLSDTRFLGFAKDITERKQAEEELRRSEARLIEAQRIANMGDFCWEVEAGNVTWSEGMYDLLGYGKSERIDFNEVNANIHHPDDLERITNWLKECLESGELEHPQNEYRLIRKDGRILNVQTTVSVKFKDGKPVEMVGTVQDITELKQSEEEKERLQEQLRQAQKMEAVGRLAGGVAHDFNNMLGVIIGHADMLLEEMDPDQPYYADLMQIKKAGERSADLTRQLLAFARKQIVTPKVIDLNKTVASMTKMLQRLIGEDIDLVLRLGDKLWPVRIDPSQIDQVLANLCVNARDAIDDVGKVTIETGNVALDEAYCRERTGFVPGEYVMLAVSDNGCGVDPDMLGKVFEPFFTTKESGKGTGLGLATVYGAVKQNRGFVDIDSEPGMGATFKIYLPRHLSELDPLPGNGLDGPVERGHETVLLVEDEPAILRMTTMMLEREGYTVVAANTPGEAIECTHAHSGDIHLLITDVIMPEMNGRDLVKNIQKHYPHIKRLFMSGYTADVIAHHGVLDEGVNFIQKPFSRGDLAVKVREVLEQE